MTNRVIITMPPEIQEEFKRAAQREGVSMAEFLRRAGKERAQRERPKPKAIGMFDLGDPDLANKASEIEFEPPSWR